MSGVEVVFAVISGVTALVNAYKDGNIIVQDIKERRRQRGALPPTHRLEESLETSQGAIESIAKAGTDRYGDAFKHGDDLAVNALKDVIIEVQASLLHHLRNAVKDDTMVDFDACIDTAIDSRVKAINILGGLYDRQKMREARQVTANAAPTSTPTPSSRRSSWLHPHRSQTANSRGTESDIRPPLFTVRDFFPSPSPSSNDRSDPRHLQAPTDIASKHHATLPRERRNTQPAMPTISRLTISSRRSTNESESSLRSPPSRAPGHQAISPPGRWSVAVHEGTFCKSALYLQGGFHSEAFKIRNQSVAMTAERHVWCCRNSRCAFDGLAERSSHGEWYYDDTVRVAEMLRFRWLFLAKSHVEQGNTRHGRHFRCLFCMIEHDPSELYTSEKALFTHVLTHRGYTCSGFLLHGPLCISTDRVTAADESTFDLCFPSALELEQTASSAGSGALPSRYTSSDNDSHWSNEIGSAENPWREND